MCAEVCVCVCEHDSCMKSSHNQDYYEFLEVPGHIEQTSHKSNFVETFMEPISVLIFVGILVAIWIFCCGGKRKGERHTSSSRASSGKHPDFIPDKFTSLDQVQDAVRKAGLESCNLIFGIDYTASNFSQGQRTFGGRSLHHMDPYHLNPYQKVIAVLGETLEPFDDDGCIPAFGFGDTFTKDNSVFSLNTAGTCQGFHGVLQAYNDVTPRVRLAGPTDFAPLIRQAMDIVTQSKSYHILIIIADGQVTSERATIEAIVDASNYPLSIIMVGVGDGPWDIMEDFDDKLPTRRFDNFQFVNFSAVTEGARNPQAAFAMHALMEIPEQYKAIRHLGLLPS